VLLRLLVPFSFSSSLSVYTLAANYMPEELINLLPGAVLPVISNTTDASQELSNASDGSRSALQKPSDISDASRSASMKPSDTSDASRNVSLKPSDTSDASRNASLKPPDTSDASLKPSDTSDASRSTSQMLSDASDTPRRISQEPSDTTSVLQEPSGVQDTSRDLSQDTSSAGVPFWNLLQKADDTLSSLSANAPLPLSIWIILWFIGFALCLGYFLFSYMRCFRRFQMSLPVCQPFLTGWYAAHPLRRRLSVRQSDMISSPLSYGILRPVILMPKTTDWSDIRSLSYVLEHEYIHIQRFDTLIKLLITAALCIHWFNPLVWVMYLLFNRDIELSCDETVLRRFGENTKSDYAMTLICMEETKSGLAPFCSSFSKNAIEERIRAIMKIRKITVISRTLAVFLVAAVAVMFATSCSTTANTSARRADAASGRDSGALRTETESTPSESTDTADISGSVIEDSTSPAQKIAYDISRSDRFPEYQAMGLSYDDTSGYLMYDGRTVGYFKDEYGPQSYTRFSDEGGELGVIVVRDSSWEIASLQVGAIEKMLNPDTNPPANEYPEPTTEIPVTPATCTDSHFHHFSIPQETQSTWTSHHSHGSHHQNGEPHRQNCYATGNSASENGSGCNTLSHYEDFGVCSDTKADCWTYHGKGIAAIYDKDHGIYTCDTVSENHCVYLEVERDADGNISQLNEITKEEMQKLCDDASWGE